MRNLIVLCFTLVALSSTAQGISVGLRSNATYPIYSDTDITIFESNSQLNLGLSLIAIYEIPTFSIFTGIGFETLNYEQDWTKSGFLANPTFSPETKINKLHFITVPAGLHINVNERFYIPISFQGYFAIHGVRRDDIYEDTFLTSSTGFGVNIIRKKTFNISLEPNINVVLSHATWNQSDNYLPIILGIRIAGKVKLKPKS